VVLQYLLEQVQGGTVTQESVDAAAQLFDDVEDSDGGIPAVEDLIALATPPLQRRATETVVQKILHDQGKGRSVTRHVDEMNQIDTIGKASPVGSVELGSGVWGGIQALNRMNRLPIGIAQIDSHLRGGIPPKTLTVYGADMNVGKTALLVHQACYAWLQGKRVIYFSTEEGVNETLARVIAWVTGEPMEEVYKASPTAQKKLRGVVQSPMVGTLVVEFLHQGSTPSHLRQAVKRILEENPKMCGEYDCLFIDYADKMSEAGDRDYTIYKAVYDGLRDIAVTDGTWVVTASQLKGLGGKKVPGPDDLADSRWKGRTADNVITLWKDEDGEQDERWYHIAKVRGPGAGEVIGPILTDLEHARMAPLPATSLLNSV